MTARGPCVSEILICLITFSLSNPCSFPCGHGSSNVLYRFGHCVDGSDLHIYRIVIYLWICLAAAIRQEHSACFETPRSRAKGQTQVGPRIPKATKTRSIGHGVWSRRRYTNYRESTQLQLSWKLCLSSNVIGTRSIRHLLRNPLLQTTLHKRNSRPGPPLHVPRAMG